MATQRSRRSIAIWLRWLARGLGTLVAGLWVFIGIGGALLVLVGVAHGVFALVAAGHNQLVAVAVTGLPFVLVGLLFLGSWWCFQSTEIAQR